MACGTLVLAGHTVLPRSGVCMLQGRVQRRTEPVNPRGGRFGSASTSSQRQARLPYSQVYRRVSWPAFRSALALEARIRWTAAGPYPVCCGGRQPLRRGEARESRRPTAKARKRKTICCGISAVYPDHGSRVWPEAASGAQCCGWTLFSPTGSASLHLPRRELPCARLRSRLRPARSRF